MLQQVNFNDSVYAEHMLPWVRRMFVAPQSMTQDTFLWNRDANQWTVDRFLADLTARYGGIDGVLLWHSYPNLGVDDRDQVSWMLVRCHCCSCAFAAACAVAS